MSKMDKIVKKGLEVCKNNHERCRFLLLCHKQNFKVDWVSISKTFPNLLFFEFNKDVHYHSKKGDSFLINEIYLSNPELNDLVQYFLKNKDKKTITTLFKERYFLFSALSIKNFGSVIDLLNKTSISKEIVSLTNEQIKLLVKKGVQVSINKKIIDKMRFISKNNFYIYIENGGALSPNLLNLLFEDSSDIELSKLCSVLFKSPNKKKLIRFLIKKQGIYKILNKFDDKWSHTGNYQLKKELFSFKKEIFSHFTPEEVKNNKFRKDFILHSKVFDLEFFQEKVPFNYFQEDSNPTDLVKNKAVKKAIQDTCIKKNKFIFDSWLISFAIKNSYPSIDEQLLLSIFNNTANQKEKYQSVNNVLSYFNIMKLVTNPKRAILLFLKEKTLSERDIRDTHLMLNKLMGINNGLIVPKFKSINDLHNWCSVEIKKLNQAKFPLNQGLDELDGYDLGDNLIMRVPKNSHDLIAIGSNLKHCVGNGGYADETILGRIKIITLHKNNELFSCIEYKDGTIIQNRGLLNKAITLKKEQELNLLSLIKKELDKTTPERIVQ